MKKLIPILCLVLIFSACKKSNIVPYTSQGTITGYDLGVCPTCGGLEIVINIDNTKDPPPFYRINKTLAELGINERTSFPINVSLNWQRQSEPAGTNYITVTQIKVVK